MARLRLSTSGVCCDANRPYNQIFFGGENDKDDALGARIAALYKELSYPSATRFKAALAKRGIQVPHAFVQQLVREQGSRQLFAPPPRFTGKVVAQHMDERWAGDVIDFQSKTTKRGAPMYVLLVQDIFSRFLFATALRSKVEVKAAFLRLVKDTGRKPDELNTDSGTEFTNRAFQAMLEREGIRHVTKEGPQDLATLDRAIGELRAVLSRRTTDGNPWYEELDGAVESMNSTEPSSLFMRDPDDVEGDEDLRFDLRYKCAKRTCSCPRPAGRTWSSRVPSERSCGRPPASSDAQANRTGARRSTRFSPRAPTAEWWTRKATPS